MPELGAIHEDVRFDWLAASDLSSEMRATAVVLETQLADRDVARRDARVWWQGRYGDEFDQRVATCVADAGRFVLSLRDAADRLDELARLARQEQDRRTQAREWEASQDDVSRTALQVGVSTTVDVTGGMAARQLTNQNPFDPQALALDTLTGVAGGGIDGIRAPRPGINPKTWDYGHIADPDILGYTDDYGQITIRHDIHPTQFSTTLRHEQVHAALSPTAGTMLAGPRAAFRNLLYDNSQLVRYSEEALAEAVGTGDLRHAVGYPFRENYKLNPRVVALEAAGSAGAVGGGAAEAYAAHELLADGGEP